MKKHIPYLENGEHAARALLLIAQWSWLRSTELGRLMYPGDPYSRKYAEKNVRKLQALRLLIPRRLPGKAGTAFVISQAGAKQLNQWSADGGYQSGKNWGTTNPDGTWSPPATWRHDLVATGVLAIAAERTPMEVYPEGLLRAQVPEAEKHPDGLLVNHQHGFSTWVEVEYARKSGPNMQHLIAALVLAARGKPPVVYEMTMSAPVKSALVAIDADAKDERGYRLNHWSRIEAAIVRRELIAPVTVVIAWVTMAGAGVSAVRFEPKTLHPNPTPQ